MKMIGLDIVVPFVATEMASQKESDAAPK
jgi:hypothetical protein